MYRGQIMTLFYVIPPEDQIPKFEGKEILLRIKAGKSSSDPLTYMAFTDIEIGAMYLNKKLPGNRMQLVTREEIEKRGFVIDDKLPMLVFETQEQVDKAIADSSGKYLKNLIR
jgi:hypothetical protein